MPRGTTSGRLQKCRRCGSVFTLTPDRPRAKVCRPGCPGRKPPPVPKERPEGFQPATADHDYTADELELLKRVDEFKRRTGTKFPLVTDVMRIMLDMGYRR